MTKVNKRVGVFSGTFDPVHLGHIEACLIARAALGLDKIVVFVEKHPKRKQNVTTFEDRMYMVRLAFQHMHDVIVAENDFDNITIENTLPYLKSEYPKHQAVLVVGSDMLKHMDAWQDIEELLNNMSICVILRDIDQQAETKKHIASLKKKHMKAVFTLLPPVAIAVSSSKVKHDLKETGTCELIHRNVLQYINDKKLYESFSPTAK